MNPDEYKLVGWISSWGVKRIARNDGVISQIGFDEKISHDRSPPFTIPLYAKVEDLENGSDK